MPYERELSSPITLIPCRLGLQVLWWGMNFRMKASGVALIGDRGHWRSGPLGAAASKKVLLLKAAAQLNAGNLPQSIYSGQALVPVLIPRWRR